MRNTLVALSCAGLSTLAACGDEPATFTATLALRAGIPTGNAEACFEVGFGQRPIREVCGAVVDGRFEADVSIACDPSVANVRTTLRLDRVDGGRISDTPLVEPCGEAGCAFDIGCGTGPTDVALAYVDDDTHADFTSTQVVTTSGAFGARFSTCDSDGEPWLLLNGADGVRHATALIAFSGAVELSSSKVVLAADPLVTCGDGLRCSLPLPSLAGEPDQLYGKATATCSDGSSVAYAVFAGSESYYPGYDWVVRHLNFAIDLDDLMAAGHVDCKVNHAATVSAGPLDLGPADAHPVASTHAPLIDADGDIACADVAFDDYYNEDNELLAVDFVRGWNLAPVVGDSWRFVPELCNSFDGTSVTSTCD